MSQGSKYSPAYSKGAKLKAIIDGVATIETAKGDLVLLDEADLPLLHNQSVHVANEYASFSMRDKDGEVSTHCVHREILQPVPGMHIDHINQNKLDNRRSNLRVGPISHNAFNKGMDAKNKSGIRGVHFRPSYRKPWIAQISAYGKKIYLGCFESKEEAADAYQRAEQEHFAGVRV